MKLGNFSIQCFLMPSLVPPLVLGFVGLGFGCKNRTIAPRCSNPRMTALHVSKSKSGSHLGTFAKFRAYSGGRKHENMEAVMRCHEMR